MSKDAKFKATFFNDMTRQLCTMETHYKQREQTVKCLIERKSINLDFGIDLD